MKPSRRCIEIAADHSGSERSGRERVPYTFFREGTRPFPSSYENLCRETLTVLFLCITKHKFHVFLFVLACIFVTMESVASSSKIANLAYNNFQCIVNAGLIVSMYLCTCRHKFEQDFASRQ